MRNSSILKVILLVSLTMGLMGCTVAGTVHVVFETKDMVRLTIHDLEVYRRWDTWGHSYSPDYDIALQVYVKNTHIGTVPGERNTLNVAVRTPKYINRSFRFAPTSYRHPPDIKIEVWYYERGTHYKGRIVDTLFIPYRAWKTGFTNGKYVDLHYTVEVEKR
ncbi:MAG: hypothetical protein GX316_09610 [Firmicutes bacterium]|nr:hypothetical protein [Bacillota bacterium]